jgi:pimeloyl-ACP methyl ester carboxylesterase
MCSWQCAAAVAALLTLSSTAYAQAGPAASDRDVMIPAFGFNLAGTLSLPPGSSGRTRHPALILVPGSRRVDRDELTAGIPVFAQLAGGLAERGYVVVRYDKRGLGKSGGRDERATLDDYAGDVLSVFKWLKKRKDVDKKRITIAGYGEGAAVAMIAAAREEDIAALILLAAPGGKGSDMVLEQQRHLLDAMNIPEAERDSKIDLQQRIQLAVLTGVGWDGIPPDVRKQADTPWFKSLLEFDPAKWISRARQPVLIVHGDLDKQVLPHHADKLGELARQRKRKADVEVVRLPGINHLLVRAGTGEVSEYRNLKEKIIVPDIASKIGEFLGRVFAAATND